MADAMWGLIGVVVGALITGVVTISAEFLRATKEARLDRDKRADDRRIGRDQFQQQQLLLLQPAIVDLVARAVASQADTDQVDQRETYLQQDANVASIQVRVADSDLRALVQRLREVADRFASATGFAGPAEFESGRAVLSEALNDANDRLGVVLRGLYPND